MLNTVEPLTAFQLEVCGNRYTPQNVVVVVVIAGEVRRNLGGNYVPSGPVSIS
jgi:hypothetical protein